MNSVFANTNPCDVNNGGCPSNQSCNWDPNGPNGGTKSCSSPCTGVGCGQDPNANHCLAGYCSGGHCSANCGDYSNCVNSGDTWVPTCCNLSNVSSSTYNSANGFCGDTQTTCYSTQHPAGFCQSRCVYNPTAGSWQDVSCTRYVPPANTPTPTPTPTGVVPPSPTPTGTQGTGGTPPAATPTNVPGCTCGSNVCADVCPVNQAANKFTDLTTVAYTTPMKCSLPSWVNFSSAPTDTDKNAWCNNAARGKGGGNSKLIDYFYYVRAVLRAPLPPGVNPDYNGDGTVDGNDLLIWEHRP